MPYGDTEVLSPDTLEDKPQPRVTIFGSFWIDETEFALPVSAIREVVNEPEQVSTVPLSPAFVLGLFNLRGMVIPIVDLRELLGLPQVEDRRFAEDGRKVAIVENGERCIGIVFDRSGEVLHEPGTPRVEYRAAAVGTEGAIIDGVIKLDGGRRMVHVLDPCQLLNIDRVPKANAVERSGLPKGDIGKRHNCISFQLGHISCAIDLRYVQEVRDMPAVDSSVFANGDMIGTAHLRGSTIPVIDFRSFIGEEAVFDLGTEVLAHRKMLVMRTEGGLIGLMVYAIESILPYFETDVMQFSKLALKKDHLVQGCIEPAPEHLVMLLDHDRLIADPDLVDAAETCKRIHSSSSEDDAAVARAAHLERRTFILFSIVGCFAMDTRVVSEVINKPKIMLSPPYALEFAEGVISLRGELITVINPRLLYGFEACTSEEPKILIFWHDERKYAILVDTVDEIVMTTEDKITPPCAFSQGETDDGISRDAGGYLHISGSDQAKRSIMLIDAGALVARCASRQGSAA